MISNLFFYTFNLQNDKFKKHKVLNYKISYKSVKKCKKLLTNFTFWDYCIDVESKTKIVFENKEVYEWN